MTCEVPNNKQLLYTISEMRRVHIALCDGTNYIGINLLTTPHEGSINTFTKFLLQETKNEFLRCSMRCISKWSLCIPFWVSFFNGNI